MILYKPINLLCIQKKAVDSLGERTDRSEYSNAYTLEKKDERKSTTRKRRRGNIDQKPGTSRTTKSQLKSSQRQDNISEV